MFIEDLKNDFYNHLLGKRVLLLVHYDVDAICTCRILQSLFKCDNIPYTLVPVGGISELKTAYEENNEEIKYVVLVNCGGTIDLVDILQPEEDVVFFVLDSHKPTDVCNVYSDSQVRLVWKDAEENIPNFEDIFRDDEDEDDQEEERGSLEEVVSRRRERRLWEENRNTLMFNYTQFSYYGKPSACVALELSWRLSRCGVAQVWCACVAAAAQEALAARPPARCLLDADDLQRHVAKTKHAGDEAQLTAKITLEKDAWLPLYRVWSLESSVRHSPSLGPHLKLHTLAGETRVRQLLADMGFPLQQARQSYLAMDVELRRELLPALEAAAAKHKLPVPTRVCFLLKRNFSPVIGALDVVYIIMALIEGDLPPAEGFQHALSALSTAGGDSEWVSRGAASARQALSAVARLVNSTIANRRLQLAGPFTYFIVHEGTQEARWVRGPLWLGVAARWASSALGGNRPLIASAPTGPVPTGPEPATPSDDYTCLLLGVPPRHEHETRNLFGAAFEQAAAKAACAVSLDHLDPSVVALPAARRPQFLDALTAILS